MNHSQSSKQDTVTVGGPFDLGCPQAYAVWRKQKLAMFPAGIEDLMVDVKNGSDLSDSEKDRILECCRRSNMAIYRMQSGDFSDKEILRNFAARFGLCRLDKNLRADEDAVTTLRVIDSEQTRNYIPYTDRTINWHTDGYYNRLDQQVRGVVMHCVSAAENGGENVLLDHEMVYLQMRDKNPDYIKALMRPDVMTIPANIENGVEVRAEQGGPVFSIDPDSGSLHMRYTARTRSIKWKDDELTSDAVNCLSGLLSKDSPFVFQLGLQPGQGIICNNVLHGRASFKDGDLPEQQRLLYRGRFYDRITG